MPSPEWDMAYGEATMTPPECPKCKKFDRSEPYMTDEAKKIIEEVMKKYREKRKKK